MRKILIIIILLITTTSYAQDLRIRNEGQHPLRHGANRIKVDTDNFGVILTPADDTLQEALDSLDDHGHAGTSTTLDVTNFDGILSNADTTSQEAFETIDDVVQNTVPCATSDPWCFVESSTGVLDLYMRSQLVQRITIVVAIAYLEDMLGANLEFMDATDIEDMDQ